MPEQRNEIFEFAPLSEYSFKEQILIRLADVAFFLSIKMIGSLTRFEVRGTEHLAKIETGGKLPIYTLWHDRIFLGTYFLRDRGIIVMTSQSFDGEYIARFIQRFGFGAIRGSSSRGGSKALVKMVKAMRDRLPMAFTVDGPRGPRYEAKLGPVILAKKTGSPILPFIVEPHKFWTVKSWDKLQIPMPFTSALAIFGEPIYVEADADDVNVESKLADLQNSLDGLVKQGKEWSRRND